MFMRPTIRRLIPTIVVTGVLISAFMAGGVKLPNVHLAFASSCVYGYGAYTGPAPVVTGVSPNFGPTTGGTNVTITGTGLGLATAVSFGSTPATTFVANSDTQVTAVSPAEPVGVVDVTVTTPCGTSATGPADHFHYVPPQAGVFKNHPPQRLLDTRSSGPKLGPGVTRNITVTGGTTGVPTTAIALVANVTATDTTALSWLTCWPTGTSMPNISNLNWVAHEVVANLVQIQIGTGGQISCNNAAGYTDIIVDVNGYFVPPTTTTDGEFVPLPPARITDTRTGSGYPNAGTHLGAGASVDITVDGAGGVPATGAEAVVFDAAATNTTALSWLTCWPTGTPEPTASNLNWTAGKVVANRVTVMIGATGKVTCGNAGGKTDIVIDVNGYYTDATATGKTFITVSPNRIVDSRNGTGGFSAKIGAGQTIVVQIAGSGGVPTMGSTTPPAAVVINVTATNTNALSWFTVYP